MGWAFASEPCWSWLPLILGTADTHCLHFLILVVFLAATWFLVVWEGWGCHMWCCLVAIVLFTSRWEDLHPDSSTFLCVYRADCSVCVCLCTWLLSAMSYCLNPPFSSGTITQADTFRQILVLLLQVFLYLKSEWWSRDKFSHCDDLLWSFSLLMVYEYLNHKT